MATLSPQFPPPLFLESVFSNGTKWSEESTLFIVTARMVLHITSSFLLTVGMTANREILRGKDGGFAAVFPPFLILRRRHFDRNGVKREIFCYMYAFLSCLASFT